MYYARLSRTDGAEAKASLNRALSMYAIDPKPSDLAMSRLKWGKTQWRTEPTMLKSTDDLWLAVKFQTNSEIAGSPRNRFRPSLDYLPGGRALFG